MISLEQQTELEERIVAAARLTGDPSFVVVEHERSGGARVILIEDVPQDEQRKRRAALRAALGGDTPPLSVRLLAPADITDQRYLHEYELMRQVRASRVVYDREGEALAEQARPGVRKRRQEAACAALETGGWRRVKEPAAEFRRYRKDGRTLVAGPGGALYWSENGGTIDRKARRNDGDAIAAALDAARAAR